MTWWNVVALWAYSRILRESDASIIAHTINDAELTDETKKALFKAIVDTDSIKKIVDIIIDRKLEDRSDFVAVTEKIWELSDNDPFLNIPNRADVAYWVTRIILWYEEEDADPEIIEDREKIAVQLIEKLST